MRTPLPNDPVIVAGRRTPFAPLGRELARWDAAGLAAAAMRAVLDDLALDASRVDEAIVGCAGNPIDAANIARVAVLRAGLPETLPACTIQRNCASGLDAIGEAAAWVSSGRARIVLAGGVEHMSSYPLLWKSEAADRFARLARARSFMQRVRIMAGFRPRHFAPSPALLVGLNDPSCGLSMGDTAELLAHELGIDRAAQDAFALESQRRALAARSSGALAREIVPVAAPPDFSPILAHDTGIREDSSAEKLARLRPVFDRTHGSVTAGNASQITDGAAMTLVTTRATADAAGWPILGRVASWVNVGVDPRRMGLGPVFAMPRALSAAGIAIGACEVIEINEAFAAQVLAVFAHAARAGWPLAHEAVNRQGGAIALGHPLGATGARLVITTLRQLEARGGRYGIASLCVGGGQGGAMVLEREASGRGA